MSTTALAPEAADEILTTRHIAAPRALVFAAWTTPGHVDAWWGPTGFTTTTKEMHVATGGTWRFTMTGPDGTVYPNRIHFIEVVPPRRLVYDHDHGDDGGGAPSFHVVVTFDEDGDGTFLAMRAKFASAEARRYVAEKVKAVEGARQTVDRLVEHVARMAARHAA